MNPWVALDWGTSNFRAYLMDYNNVIDQSLRFDDGDSPRLSKTFGSGGSRTTFTYAAWVKRSVITQEDAEAMTLDFLSQHVGKNVSPLCGNTVWHDRKFLTLYMPQLEDYFHYRVIDVSSVKELTKRWRPDATKPKSKEIAHRARPDVFESIEELRFYRDHIFAQ